MSWSCIRCRACRYPRYAYARSQGSSPEDAEDLAQQFFLGFLEKDYLTAADRGRGRFRTFLLASMTNFLVNQWRSSSRLKRGGAHSFIPLDGQIAESRYATETAWGADPESTYERQWAVALVERVFAVLRREYVAMEKGPLLEEMKGFIWGEESLASNAQIGSKLRLSEGAVKVAVYRLRQRFRELLRAEVAQTVATPEEVDAELRHLIAVLR